MNDKKLSSSQNNDTNECAVVPPTSRLSCSTAHGPFRAMSGAMTNAHGSTLYNLNIGLFFLWIIFHIHLFSRARGQVMPFCTADHLLAHGSSHLLVDYNAADTTVCVSSCRRVVMHVANQEPSPSDTVNLLRTQSANASISHLGQKEVTGGDVRHALSSTCKAADTKVCVTVQLQACGHVTCLQRRLLFLPVQLLLVFLSAL